MHNTEAELKHLDEEHQRRERELEAAAQQIAHLEQLKRYASAESRMRTAQSEMQQLEISRASATTTAMDASMQLEALREELYEVPLQTLMSGQPAEITELQVEAYLERHRVDALMEDLLASVIQHMPTYPIPFLINLLRKKSGAAALGADASAGLKASLEQVRLLQRVL